MTLPRRTGLTRKTGLAPGRPPARLTPLLPGDAPQRSAHLTRSASIPRDRPGLAAAKPTGPSREVRDLVVQRDRGRCAWCSTYADGPAGYSLQHRLPRGAGGTNVDAVNSPANLIVMCGSGTTGCHGLAEHHPGWARLCGYKIPRGADTEPARIPVWRCGRWVLLADDGTVELGPRGPRPDGPRGC